MKMENKKFKIGYIYSYNNKYHLYIGYDEYNTNSHIIMNLETNIITAWVDNVNFQEISHMDNFFKDLDLLRLKFLKSKKIFITHTENRKILIDTMLKTISRKLKLKRVMRKKT